MNIVLLLAFVKEMIGLYSMAAIGYVARKINILDANANEVITQLLLYITLPALILYSMNVPFSYSMGKELLILFISSLYVLLSACVIARLMRKRSKIASQRKNVFEALIIFGNQGFIGYTICYILFSEKGIIYATMFNFAYLLLIWSYGIYLFLRSTSSFPWKQVFFNPGILSTIAGLLIFLLPIGFPQFVSDILNTIGKMTIPLSMILIGSLLKNIKVKDVFLLLKNVSIWQIAIVKLIILPLILFPLTLLPLPFTLIGVAVLMSGMPCAPTVSLYALKYGGDSYFTSLAVFFTTLCTLVTIPILYLILMNITI
ncbi:AEC family transporter [Priestia filamentosa]|uniref:AEC family transporter n=1 Tax=Priestia filamentosa TaxID=1402861 RepID=UPI0002FC560A|nr:AEC family transporter [Priestia filamentosa]